MAILIALGVLVVAGIVITGWAACAMAGIADDELERRRERLKQMRDADATDILGFPEEWVE